MSSARDPADLDPAEFAAHDRFIRAVIRRFVADHELLEDLTQDTWLAALQHSAASRSFRRAWLGTVAQNFVFQSLRGAARRRAREASAARLESAPSDAPLDPDLRRRVLEAVRALEEPYRSAVHLRFFEDLPPTAIAERLGTRPETTHAHQARAGPGPGAAASAKLSRSGPADQRADSA